MMRVALLFALILAPGGFVAAQQGQPGAPPAAARFDRPAPATGMPEEPREFGTLGGRLRVSTVVRGLANPWSMAFLPNGDMLVTEKPGRLRIIRNGVLDPTPISGVPTQIWTQGQAGLLEISLHPQFAQNRVVYLTYSKLGEGERAKQNTTAVLRARLEGNALVDGKEIFVANAWREANQHFGGRIAWGRDGTMFLSVGERNERARAQDTMQHAGKILRLRDDGTVPPDNPFVGRQGFLPEIYSYGHRNPQGLAVHPVTGELFETEHGPLGGDELNIVKPGLNYGWPVATYGREYTGEFIAHSHKEGIEAPLTVWVPSIALSGMAFYTGDKLPNSFRNNLFVGGMSGLQLNRVVFNAKGDPMGREALLSDLRLRIRDVRQGPDGFLYLAVDAPQGGILRIEPAAPATTTSTQQ